MILAGALAIAVAALFAGAALYINVAEQPARLGLADGPLLAQWKPAYGRGFALQAPLAVAGCVLGLVAWWQIGSLWWVAGAVLMIAHWPYTLLVIMPTNHRLGAIDADRMDAATGAGARAMIEHWGRLHAVRTGLGFAALLCFLVAASR